MMPSSRTQPASQPLSNRGALSILVAMIVAFAWLPHPAASQDISDMTAEELVRAGSLAFEAQDWERTAALYSRLINAFGDSEELKPLLPRVVPILAISQVYLRQFEEARANIERTLELEGVDPDALEELLFWKGICELQAGDQELAQQSFLQYAQLYPRNIKAPEAIILAASTMILREDPGEASEFLKEARDQLEDVDRARAVVLELYSLTRAGRFDEALELFVQEYPNMGDMPQLITFQTVGLELGSRFLENEEYHRAIAALQRIWSRDRLLEHQQERLQSLTERKEAAQRRTAEEFLAFQLGQTVTKIRRELESFEEIEHFDSALRLRLATAYQGMQRYREAALILEDMLARMPPDPIVEQASLNLVQCWTTIDRYPKAVEAADLFEERFPNSEHLPLVLLMKGQAQQSDGEYDDSIETLQNLVQRFPDSRYAPRALFLAGFGYLLKEDYEEAIPIFESFPGQFPQDELEDTVFYWRAMAYSMNQEHERTRELMAEYLTRYPEGRWRGEATFRKAYSAHSLRDYDTGIPELRAFIAEYPGHLRQDEAWLLLGDALMAEGALEQGMEAYANIDSSSTQFFEQGWFQTGRALRLLEDNEALRAHMQRFVENYPQSTRVAEAVYWIGWTYRNDGEPERAVEAYWAAIEDLGNDPEKFSVEDLFPALARLYSGDEERRMYDVRLRDLREQADDRGQETLALRALWAQAQLWQRSDPARSRQILVEAAERADPSLHNPLVVADIADALREEGRNEEAHELYTEFIRWNPRAIQRDRAFAGLGLLAMEEGRERAALDYFERFERETMGSPLYADIMLAKAHLEAERGAFEAAQKTLETLLGHETAGGLDRVRALHALGELMMRTNRPDRAVAYFQRIYVLYGRWGDYVAKAYLRSGQAFEELGEREKAARTYGELVQREELSDFEETGKAKERLQVLGFDPEDPPQEVPEPMEEVSDAA